MVDDKRENLRHWRVGHQGNPIDRAVMVFNETTMLDEVTNTLPAGKSPCSDDQAIQLFAFLDHGIDLLRDGLEVIARQRSLRLDQAMYVSGLLLSS